MASKNSLEDKVGTILALLIGSIILLGQIFPEHIAEITEWLTSIAAGAILSAIAGEIIERFSGDFFKRKFKVRRFFGINFYVPLFPIIIIVFKAVFF